jgi:ankyrin repeat protein
MRTALFGSTAQLTALLDNIDNKIDANRTTANGTSLLMMAAPDAAKVLRLISRGADAAYRAPSGSDALTAAASYRGSSEAMLALLDAAADAQPPDDATVKRAPLVFASMSGDLDAVALLLSRGSKPGADALSEAVTFGRADVVQALIAAGAKVDLVERTGVNLLHWATITNRARVIPELAKAGVDIDAIDEFGFTPLMYAATIDFGDTSTLHALLAAGADRAIRNASGRTALQQALHFGHRQLAAALQP